MIECLEEELKKSEKLGLDLTPVRVLDPGPGQDEDGYMWQGEAALGRMRIRLAELRVRIALS